MATTPFSTEVTPDWESFVRCLRPGGKPANRVHHIELFLDREIEEAICQRYGVLDGMDRGEPFVFERQRSIRLRRFLGYDYIHCGVPLDWPMHRHEVDDTAELSRHGGRSFVDLHAGPITNWKQFEAYPWPDPAKADLRTFEWCQKHLPDDMCLIGGFTGHFCELLTWLMGYETLCTSLYDQPVLVQAMADWIARIELACVKIMVQFDRVKAIWGSDDMGFRSGTLISPDDMRKYALGGHRDAARLAHEAGRPYLLHSCGNLDQIMEDLIESVRVDAKHSYEDVIMPPEVFMQTYGDRMAVLGGIDVDFLCRSDEAAIRRRVRQTLEACMPHGGYCLGTGNSVTNYIPVDAYLAMVDEGRRFVL